MSCLCSSSCTNQGQRLLCRCWKCCISASQLSAALCCIIDRTADTSATQFEGVAVLHRLLQKLSLEAQEEAEHLSASAYRGSASRSV